MAMEHGPRLKMHFLLQMTDHKNPYVTFHYTGWLIAILIMVYYAHMDASKNRGTPKWMVYSGKPIKMDDLGVPLFLETPI